MTTGLTHDPDHAVRGVARLIERYRRPRTSALLESWLGEVQSAEDALWQLLIERSVTTAVGAQLDVLGAIVGQAREGRADEPYRVWISARNMVSRSSGTTAELLALARKLLPADVTISLEEYYPAAVVVRLGAVTLDAGYHVAHMLHLAKAAGVLLEATWPVAATATFAFAPLPATPVLGSAIGFDAGGWAAVTDGATIPVEPDVSGTPPGQLVIHDVPLVLHDVPLVITPAARALPVTIAKPATIVPRAARAGAIIPAPLVGETIELEDAFADTSLEMDAAGALFRVAAGLQAEVGAIRFAFTQRAESVSGAAFEEIGVMRFDATPFGGAMRFVAELEVSAAGQTAEVQLYNLTTAAAVATVSTTALVTTKVTSDVTLPLVEQLYSLRLRLVGGAATHRASCRSACFEADHD